MEKSLWLYSYQDYSLDHICMLESTFKVVVLASQLLASTTMYFLRHYIIITIMYTTLNILTRNKIYTSDHQNLYLEIKFDYLYNYKGIPLQMAFTTWYKG